MPDTIRTLAQLNAQFADSGAADISAQDMRDLFVSLMVHGEIGSGAKSAINLAAAPTFTTLDLTVAGVIGRGLTVDTVNKRISDVPVAIGAEVMLEVAFTGAANTSYELAVLKNGSPVARLTSPAVRVVTVVQGASFTMSSSLDLAPGDVVSAAVRPTAAGTPSFTLQRAALRVRRIAIE